MPTLKKQVFDICQNLAQHGWADLLKNVTSVSDTFNSLDINQANEDDLEAELLKEIEIDRLFPGFEDFAIEGGKGITPSKPAHSLLYHALASPNVIWQDKHKTKTLLAFPSIKQIEVIENYVFGVQPPSISFLRNLFPGKELALVVFANQYRTAVDTPHVKHADLVFSRTGISRVGTEQADYNPQTRSFNMIVTNNAQQLRILPAKFNLYLAVKLNGSSALLGRRFNTALQVFENAPSDEELFFWYPIHKVFPGDECFQNVGKPVSFIYMTQHKNEKIKRVHKFLIDKFEINPGSAVEQFNKPPFTITDLATVDMDEAMALILPKVNNALVEEAVDSNGSPITMTKSFPLPLSRQGIGSLDSFSSSLELRSAEGIHGMPRQAPEYLHIRTEIAGRQSKNLNDRKDLISFIDSPSIFKSMHYQDSTGDGYVTVKDVTGVPGVERIIPAYSLIAAPDFFPFVEQAEVLNETLRDLNIWQVPPLTIADTRLLPNVSSHPELKMTSNEAWDTVTALIPSTLDINVQQTRFTDKIEARVSYLTDGAAGVFAPGWDTSFDVMALGGVNIPHLSAYGLGSPFPEDSKLCAALSSFWPAVAPDISRSFWPENGFSPTVVPLLDSEIGAHNESTSWDGEKGPVLINKGNKKMLRYKKFEYVDYTLNALHNTFNFVLLAKVDAIEYIARLKKMKAVKNFRNGEFNSWLFSSYTQVDVNDADVQKASQQHGIIMKPIIHKFVFLRQKALHHVDSQFQLIDVEVDKEAIIFVDAAEQLILLE